VHDRLARLLEGAPLHPRAGENAHGGERGPKGRADGEVDARVALRREPGAARALKLAACWLLCLCVCLFLFVFVFCWLLCLCVCLFLFVFVFCWLFVFMFVFVCFWCV
jgi:Flp pilus assembly protein TadB